MPNGAYTECVDAEDPACSNWVDLSVNDHRFYFGENVGSYCCYNGD
jgi:hypothetical protein